jgi:hypothetical protein
MNNLTLGELSRLFKAHHNLAVESSKLVSKLSVKAPAGNKNARMQLLKAKPAANLTNNNKEYLRVRPLANEASQKYRNFVNRFEKVLRNRGLPVTGQHAVNLQRAHTALINAALWNTTPALINLPNNLRNNVNSITGMRFKYGVPYVETTSRGKKHYYSKAAFKTWYNKKRAEGVPVTNLYTRAALQNNNMRLVVFKVPQNLKNKLGNVWKKRAARIIQRKWRK